jgi:hypothetical protein
MNDISQSVWGRLMSEQIMLPRIGGLGVIYVLPEYRKITANLAAAPTVSVIIPTEPSVRARPARRSGRLCGPECLRRDIG